MFTPCGPKAVPTGGAGVAWAAGDLDVDRGDELLFSHRCAFGVRAGPRGGRRGRGGVPPPQIFSTCQYSNSVGRGLPKISISTVTLPCSSSIASTVPSNVSNGPSLILTGLADRQVDLDLGGLLLAGLRVLVPAEEHPLHLGGTHRRGAGVPAAALVAGEVAHPGRVADEVPSLVAEPHLDHHIAGEELLLDHPLFPALGVHDLLGRDHDLPEVLVHRLPLDAGLQRLLDRLLPVRSHLQHEPLEAVIVAPPGPRRPGRRPAAPGPGRRRPPPGAYRRGRRRRHRPRPRRAASTAPSSGAPFAAAASGPDGAAVGSAGRGGDGHRTGGRGDARGRVRTRLTRGERRGTRGRTGRRGAGRPGRAGLRGRPETSTHRPALCAGGPGANARRAAGTAIQSGPASSSRSTPTQVKILLHTMS